MGEKLQLGRWSEGRDGRQRGGDRPADNRVQPRPVVPGYRAPAPVDAVKVGVGSYKDEARKANAMTATAQRADINKGARESAEAHKLAASHHERAAKAATAEGLHDKAQEHTEAAEDHHATAKVQAEIARDERGRFASK